MSDGMTVPEHEWDGEAIDVARDHGRSIGNARDLVIMDWLLKGDTRPLSDWLMRGHVPSAEVMKALAVMLVRGHPDADQKWFDNPAVKETAEIFTLGLTVVGKGKRSGDPVNHARDKRIALEAARLMASEKTEDEAFKEVSEWAYRIGIRSMGYDNVKKIYQKNKRLIVDRRAVEK